MTTSRFSSLSLLLLVSCGDPAGNVSSRSAPAPAPSLVVEAGGRTYAIDGLLRERGENPNRFELLVRDYTVRAPIAEIPRFDQARQGSAYHIPLTVNHVEPNPEIERDFREMSPAQLYGKYGEDADRMLSAQSENDARRRRGEPERSFAELNRFRATAAMENYTVEQAARLNRGQNLLVRCRDMHLSPGAVVFLRCSDHSSATASGNQP